MSTIGIGYLNLLEVTNTLYNLGWRLLGNSKMNLISLIIYFAISPFVIMVPEAASNIDADRDGVIILEGKGSQGHPLSLKRF